MDPKRLAIADKDPRVYFAAERTFLAWIRTGIALMGFGFVVARFGIFLRELRFGAGASTGSTGISLWTGTALVFIGIIVDVASSVQYIHVIRDLNSGRDPTGRPSPLALGVAVMLALIGLAASIYLIAMP
jgi:putative membrane protein